MESLIFIKERIAAIITKPETEPKGLVIICAGYLDSKDHKHFSGLAEDLTKAGYTTVRFDPTGIWESYGTIEQYTIPQQLQDIQDITDYMFKEKAYKNIIVGGHSLGGFVALLYASSHSIVTKAFAIMSPYALNQVVKIENSIKWKNDGFRTSLRDIPNTNEKKEFRVPVANFVDASKYNLLEIAPSIKIPILLIAGELDDSILPKNVEILYNKLGGYKKNVVIHGVGHIYRHKAEHIHLVDYEIINFLESS